MTDTLPRHAQLAPLDGRVPPRRRAHRPPRRALVALIAVLALAAGTTWFLRPTSGAAPLTASGTVEVEERILAAQSAGTVAELLVDEGSRVTEGQLVGRLSDPVLNVQVKQAVSDAAQQQVTQAQMARLELRAPISGPGSPILTVADPTMLKLTLYVLEGDLGRVAVGQGVTVYADAFPGRVFAGQVKTIATRAEFTPRNVQTQKDRQNLVFAVTVLVPNPDAALKAGLPVDATFDASSP